jgi:hypothetical protein
MRGLLWVMRQSSHQMIVTHLLTMPALMEASLVCFPPKLQLGARKVLPRMNSVYAASCCIPDCLIFIHYAISDIDCRLVTCPTGDNMGQPCEVGT